jgi:hypothetical protein
VGNAWRAGTAAASGNSGYATWGHERIARRSGGNEYMRHQPVQFRLVGATQGRGAVRVNGARKRKGAPHDIRQRRRVGVTNGGALNPSQQWLRKAAGAIARRPGLDFAAASASITRAATINRPAPMDPQRATISQRAAAGWRERWLPRSRGAGRRAAARAGQVLKMKGEAGGLSIVIWKANADD